MGRTVKSSRKREPPVRPVQRIELSEENTKKRAIAAVLFFLIGIGLLVYCFVTFITPDAGWTTIEATQTVNDSSEFVFQYYLGADGANVNAENRAITALYNRAAERAYQLFHSNEAFDDVVNIYSINQNPNAELEIDEALYKVFSAFKEADSRYLYIAPLYSRYSSSFFCTEDYQLADFDPLSDEGVREEFVRTAEYINDPEMIEMQLLGNNKIKLFVSDKYLEYAEKEGITEFIGLTWLKNAFEADYLADTMIENGFTRGSISSYDGFVRNFDATDTEYSFNIFDKKGEQVYLAGIMQYKDVSSIVFLRDYAMNSLDTQHYYKLQNGEIRTPYLNISDGVPGSSLNNLVSYSKDKGCGEIVLEILDIYISDKFDSPRLEKLSDKGIYSIFSDGYTLRYNEKDLVLTNLFDQDGAAYKAEYTKKR